MQEYLFASSDLFLKFALISHSQGSQNSEQFENFVSTLQTTLDLLRRERLYTLIVSGDFNCRSPQWWTEDLESPEGTAVEELIESNNLCQLIDEPTNIRGEGMSCIDLTVTDQPNMFVEHGVHPLLDEHCQHQIIYGKLNITVPSPPPYKRTVWDYSKADTKAVRDEILGIDWVPRFTALSSDEMTECFTQIPVSTFNKNIPNKVVKIDDKDPPWITPGLKQQSNVSTVFTKDFSNVGGGRRIGH